MTGLMLATLRPRLSARLTAVLHESPVPRIYPKRCSSQTLPAQFIPCGMAHTTKLYPVRKDFDAVSEYQYYEFQAIDRPLDEADKEALGRLSSRATITSTTFTNEYQWGDFRGDPRKMMERWFDLHLYLANWGTRRLMIRLPKRLIDQSRLDDFVTEVDEVEVYGSGENLIVDISFNSEESGYDYEYQEDGSEWLGSLAPLRSDLLSGDLRLFYILWLTAVERGLLADHCEEPLPGIGPLSTPLTAFAEFFGIDQDLVRAAAASPTTGDRSFSLAEASRIVIESIPEDGKTALLLRLANGDPHVGAEIRNQIRAAWEDTEGQRRTVAEIRKGASAVREKRKAETARRKEAERLRKEQEAGRAQRARLESMKRRGARVWGEVEREIGYTNPSSYDRAVGLLVDLRALARENGSEVAFAKQVESIRERHARKRAFIQRLDAQRIGLG